MRIGYPCINRSIGCRGDKTFRLQSYTEERLIETVENNLACLQKMLQFNAENGLLYFRISSNLIPFASHPVCELDWASRFKADFRQIGNYIKKNNFRIAMHPDQYVVLNSPKPDVVQRSIDELVYHAKVLDLMKLRTTAKIQIHVGGVYQDIEAAKEKFVSVFYTLPSAIRRRLCIENDHRLFSLASCMDIHGKTGIPIIFDAFHHSIKNRGEPMALALEIAESTWAEKDGVLLVDYSSQKPGGKTGAHADTISEGDFAQFLKDAQGIEFDLMLEIKDKEASAMAARDWLKIHQPSLLTL